MDNRPNDMAPHSAVVQISWEIHEKKQNGSYYGNAKDIGKTVFVLDGNDLALTQEYLNALMDLIKEGGRNVSELKTNQERLGQTHIQGSSGLRNNSPRVFGMRGRVGEDSTS